MGNFQSIAGAALGFTTYVRVLPMLKIYTVVEKR